MFNDERIIKEVSKLKRIILYIIAILSALTIIFKVFLGSASNFWYYASEGFNLIVSLFVLIIDFKFKPTDEMEEEKKCQQLDKYFKYSICVIYFWYSICAGVVVSLGENVKTLLSPNHTMNAIITISLLVAIAYLKFKSIYLNYSFIQESLKEYTKKVLINTLKLLGYICLCLLISFIVIIIVNPNYLASLGWVVVSIILAIIASALSLCGCYLIFSVIERIQYSFDKKHETLTPKGSFVTLIFNLITVVIGILQLATYVKLNAIVSSGNLTGEIVGKYMTIRKSYQTYFLFSLALFMCYLTSDYIKRHNNKNILYLLLGTISMAVFNIITSHYNIYQTIFLNGISDRDKIMDYNEIARLVVFIIDLLAVGLSLYGLFKAYPENKKSNKVIAFGVLLFMGMNIFLNTQSQISIIVSYILGSINTLYMVCLICSIFIISIDLRKELKKAKEIEE